MSAIDVLIEQRLSPQHARAVEEFAHAYLRRADRDSEDGSGAEALYHEVLGAFELAAGRDGAPMAVRAFNPTLAEHGYQPAGSVLETSTEDLPFLVDSVTAELHARGLGVVRVAHPVVGTERDAGGAIARVLHPAGAPATESVMHFELDRRLGPEELAELEGAVRGVLADVRRVVRDFPAMRARLDEMIGLARAASARHDFDEVDETVAFLQWLAAENLILLGAREYELTGGTLAVVPGSGLGLLADGRPEPGAAPGLRGDDLLAVAKADALSPVHRRARMDDVSVQRVAPDGTVVGESRMLGLLTTKAYAEPASETPLLARKLARILAAEDLIKGSHDYKAAVSLFESFPKDELLAAPVEDLRRAVVALMALAPERIGVLGRRAADGRSASIIVALPKARYDAALLGRLRALLAARFDAEAIDAQEVLGEGDRVRVHVTVHRPQGGLPEVSLAGLRAEVVELARTWDDRVRERLVAEHGPERGGALAARWAARLPPAYKAAIDPDAAALDIAGFERLFASGQPFTVALRNEVGPDGRALTRVGLHRVTGKAELSRVMPILEHLGLRVIEERATRLLGPRPEEPSDTWLQDFGVLGPGGRPLDVGADGERVAAAMTAVWRGEAESDSLNRLVIAGGLDWRQVGILRAYRKYRQRIGSRFTEDYQNDVIAANAPIAAKLMRLFALRFDVARPRDEEAEAALREEVLADLEQVPSLDHDRILRNQLATIEATLRTNAYRPGRRALAFKLRSADVPAIPQPPPLFEIYVYSPEVEGIHLRAGRIARGGIRWSDRMDYRTEVYGLMRAQMTKNAIIVPDGAKGGFYLKRPPADPAELPAEVERQYVAYVSGLLDLTDDLRDGDVVHPEGVRVLDDDDTYLVVAADKGTARLSDTANRVAARYGFWLGDAFASGGSKGYDHKALGITARGAWRSLERHFRELDLDPARDEFTVVGIGDMSGDVFGNGMLLSDRIRLVAAYDHRHVFLDPDPDAAASIAERRRLFERASSSWDDYDRALISAGGGVWPRSAKRVPISAPARAALGIEDEELAPSDLIRAILRAPVDVLWNGGIGTVVKASAESHEDARDRGSDAIRVDAGELRCRVVVEGGNLGLTQRARVEYSSGGGLVNADFIDNSAGVDCSDHEVNLKVLLDLAVRRGDLAPAERDALLAEVTEDVVGHVLYDSFLQAQILAQEVRSSAGRLPAYEELIERLEAAGLVDRALEALPSAEELAARRRAGRGMERPELAVLLAHAKRLLTGALLRSALPDDPYLEALLREYFPDPVVERFGDRLGEHPLRRELVATMLANRAVDGLGPTFVSRLMGEQGAEPAAVVRAYWIAREVTDAERRWAEVEALGPEMRRAAQWELMEGVDRLVEATARWFLAHPTEATLADEVAGAREPFARLERALPELGSPAWGEQREAVARGLAERGVPAALARERAFERDLVHAPAAIAVARATGRPVEEVGRALFAVGEGLSLPWLEGEVEALPAATRLQRQAAQALRDDVLRVRGDLAARALAEAPGASADEAVAAFLAAHPEACRRLAELARSLSGDGGDLAGVVLAVRRLQALAA